MPFPKVPEPKSKVLSVKVRPTVHRRLLSYSQRTGQSVSGVIQDLILGLAADEQPEGAGRTGLTSSSVNFGRSADEGRPAPERGTADDLHRATAIGHPAATNGLRGVGDHQPTREEPKTASGQCGWGCPSLSQVEPSKANPEGSQAPESGAND